MSDNNEMDRQTLDPQDTPAQSNDFDEELLEAEVDKLQQNQEQDAFRQESLPSFCPNCGNRTTVETAGFYTKCVCNACGKDFGIVDTDQREAYRCFYNYANAVIAGCNEDWNDNQENVKRAYAALKPYVSLFYGEPYFAMLDVARLTSGFRPAKYRSLLKQKTSVDEDALNNIESTYNYVCEHEADYKENGQYKHGQLGMMLARYERIKRKNKNFLFKVASIVLGSVVSLVIAALLALYFHTPITTHNESGVVFHIPYDSVSMFEKFSISPKVERHPEGSATYVDAKNALSSVSEKFTLYDLSLTNGNRGLDFNGTVTVELPIPAGYDTSSLKIYHVKSDEEFEEVESTLSVANNTITFKTTHFSLYAIAERHPIITFDTGVTDEIERQIVKRDTLAQEPTNPIRIGYTFAGWQCEGDVWDFATDTVKKDITLIAKWIPNTYTVTLDSDGGYVDQETISVSYASPYTQLPATALKEGFTFVGWYTAQTNGKKINPSDTVQIAENHTLFAHFEKNTNRVVFHKNGGSGEMSDFELKTNETARLPKNLFSKTGYTFIGWSTTLTGEVVYGDQSNYSMGTDTSYTLYAQWEINVNTVRFDKNGGEGTMSDIHMTYGFSQRLPENTFSRLGYTFKGWSTTPNGEVVYLDKTNYTMGANPEYVLYAKWEKTVYKIHFHPAHGSGRMENVELTLSDEVHLPKVTFVREGYNFLGWGLSQDGPVICSDEAEFQLETDADVTLYAIWVGKENSFTFVANGGSGSMQSDFTIATGTTAALPLNKFTRDGYDFIGWSTDPHGDMLYGNGAMYTMSAPKHETLYALWEPIVYEITFVSNGGVAIDKITYTIEDSRNLPTTSKIGYVGSCEWYTSASFSGDPVSAIAEGTFGDITLYAKWTTPIQYTITFVTNGGESAEEISYTVESDTFDLPTTSKIGYVGSCEWYTSASFSGDPVSAIAEGTFGDLVLYAKWTVPIQVTFVHGSGTVQTVTYSEENGIIEPALPQHTGYTCEWANYTLGNENLTVSAVCSPVTYQITFITNGGNAVSTIDYTIETNTFELPQTTKIGYKTLTWYENSSFTGNAISVIEKGTNGNKTLYANWSNPIQVTFMHNGETVQTVTYSEENGITEPHIPSQKGYVCAWEEYTVGSQNITVEAECTLIEYTITFVTNGGESVEDISYTVKSDTFELPTTFKIGYVGSCEWHTSASFSGEPVTTIEMGTVGDMIFYADWSNAPLEEYTITFHTNGGKAIDPITYTIEDLPLSLADCISIKTGCMFVGWYTNESCTGTPISEMSVGAYGNKDLYCQWLSESDYNACFEQYKVTESYGTYSYNKDSTDVLLPGDTLQMIRVPNQYLYDGAPYNFHYVMVDGHWNTSQPLTEDDIVYGELSGVGMIDRNGSLTIGASCTNGKTFTVVVLDNNNGNPDYSSYSENRVFHFTVGEKNADFASGLGSETRPYLIAEASHLIQLSSKTAYYQDATLYFQLYNDIDMEMDSNKNTAFVGIPEFYGSFDGNGHRIYNFKISTSSEYAAFFGILRENAIVENLTIGKDNDISDVYSVTIIANKYSTSGLHVGAIVGENRGTISNCLVEDVYLYGMNDVDAGRTTDLVVYVGGVTGINYGTVQGCTVTDSYIEGRSSTTHDTNPAITESKIGGIAGYCFGNVDDCCVYDSSMYAYSYSVDKNAAFKDNDEGDARIFVGILVGQAVSPASITNCYATNIEWRYDIVGENKMIFVDDFVPCNQGAVVENCQSGRKP